MKLSISLASIALAVSLGSSIAEAASCSALYGQCGGVGWSGPTCCVSGAKCVAQANNKYYSQCLPASDSSSNNNNNNGGKKTTVKKHTSNKTKKSTKKDTSHPPKKTTTKKASRTTTADPKPTGSSGSGSSGNSGYSVVPGGVSGPGQTTRYWDCCKPSCGWNGKAKVSAPVDSCAKNGITIVDDNVQSGCAGGNAFVCNNNQPWAVNDNLAYGFAAATLVGSSEGQWCCACYELTFTSSTVAGKKMVVQVTNTGSDLGSNSGNVAHFDLLMPGGGVGLFNGCQPQWNAPDSGWGARYGGISDASACNSLPSALQPGCKWRYTWFKNADNPNMTFKEVTCPAEIIQRSGCKRL